MKERVVNGHEPPPAKCVTPESSRLSRRRFIRRAGLLSAGLAALPLLSACGGAPAPNPPKRRSRPRLPQALRRR